MYKSGSWPTNPGRGRGEKEGQDHKEERWEGEGGESQLEASCQLQTNRFMYIPSTSSQKLIFSAIDNRSVSSRPKWSMAFSFHTALQTARSLADSSQGKRGGLRTALVRAAPQGWPEADRGDGVCRSFVVPALDRRNRSSYSQLRSTSLT